MKKNIVAIVAALLLNACATSGNPALAEMDQISLDQHLVKGKSTKADVLAYLGPAGSFLKEPDNNTETWVYNYSSSNALGMTFIPIYGLTHGGETKQSKSLTIIFNGNGIVIRYSLATNNRTQTIGY